MSKSKLTNAVLWLQPLNAGVTVIMADTVVGRNYLLVSLCPGTPWIPVTPTWYLWLA